MLIGNKTFSAAADLVEWRRTPKRDITIPVGVGVAAHAQDLLQILFRVESPQAAAPDRLGHREAGPSSSAGLYLGHAEIRLQEKVHAAVGQHQRTLEDPGEQIQVTVYAVHRASC